MAETEEPIWGDELEDYMNLGTDSTDKWVKATNLLSWEFNDDDVTYEPDMDDAARGEKLAGWHNAVSRTRGWARG